MEFWGSYISLSVLFFVVMSGVGAESVGSCLLVLCMIAVYEVAVDCSVFFGVMVCLTYVSALLILFLFFVALAPGVKENSMDLGWLVRISFMLGVVGGFCSVSQSDEVEGMSGISYISFLFSGNFSWYLFLFGLYLLVVVVLVAKVSNRDSGAMRVGIYS